MSTDAVSSGLLATGPEGRIFVRRANRFWALVLLVSLLLGFDGQIPAQSVSRAQRADTILIVKHERKLYLLRDNSPLRSYRIALGLSPTGAKQREWDFRTPEGSYIIDFRQEHSHYFKALHISYPSPADLKRSSALHSPAGRDIFIHGEPNQPTKPVSYYKTRDWTNGCIALSDEDLQDVWNLTAGQTRVEIVP
jgi:murein L,D-transpeptidase YafK